MTIFLIHFLAANIVSVMYSVETRVGVGQRGNENTVPCLYSIKAKLSVLAGKEIGPRPPGDSFFLFDELKDLSPKL